MAVGAMPGARRIQIGPAARDAESTMLDLEMLEHDTGRGGDALPHGAK